MKKYNPIDVCKYYYMSIYNRKLILKKSEEETITNMESKIKKNEKVDLKDYFNAYKTYQEEFLEEENCFSFLEEEKENLKELGVECVVEYRNEEIYNISYFLNHKKDKFEISLTRNKKAESKKYDDEEIKSLSKGAFEIFLIKGKYSGEILLRNLKPDFEKKEIDYKPEKTSLELEKDLKDKIYKILEYFYQKEGIMLKVLLKGEMN